MAKINLQRSSLKNVKDHTLIVPLYQQGTKATGPKNAGHLKALIGKLVKDKVHTGVHKKLAHLRYVQAGRANNILFVGLGKKGNLTCNKIREALVHAAAHLSRHKTPSFSFHLDTIEHGKKCSVSELTQLVAESLTLPLYQFVTFKSKASTGVKTVTLACDQTKDLTQARKGASKAKTYLEACNMVRDLVNTPSNELRTTQYADFAQQVGKKAGLKVKVFKEKELERDGFNALLSVNKGSDQPARMVVLEHNASKKGLDTICLVGKGITFDTGGISLKPSAGMGEMKMDMAGSATVLGIMQVVATLNLPLHVVGVMAITDNMPSGKATVPGDIVTAYNGKTIEILNTDAEGRLILADAMAYAEKHYKPKLLMDFATLTGACIIALGNAGTAIMGTDQSSMDKLKCFSEATGEKVWQLPIWDELATEMVSDCADIKNIGTTRGAGTAKAAYFLQNFVSSKTPWVHFDIAGTAYIPKPTNRYAPKGATAACVRLVTEFLANWKK